MSHTTKQLEDAIFYSASCISDSAQRRQFLDQACAGNPKLRSVVEEMLCGQADAEKLFIKGRSAMQLASEEIVSLAPANETEEKKSADEHIGMRIGCYKILQKIGEGGCGVVYMAEQEKPVRRSVAVKIIKLGMDTKSVIARFDAERQALAMMDHPNIARVLDAGATENGRPYFVMELVRGVKITEYCDGNNFDTRQRLELFIQICHAVQHAHQKGIIHRDIKPSNIMVTLHDGVPVPKVIDFGIAKAIEGKLTDQTLFTAYEQLIGTPAYMSPEQAEMSGLDVDTRSDIYSLGVLLYELLTGRTPFDPKELIQSGLDEMRRTLREKEPQRPSTMLTTMQNAELTATAQHRHEEPPKLVSLMKGDLDWIVMKALEKDRTRRYETANGLAMDVQRYLNNEPVVARPPSRIYRLQKLVRRNRIVFASGVAVAVALIAGLGTATWMFFREREARQEQARLREKAEEAERQQNELRQQAEAREKINQAAIFVSQEKFDEANKLLDSIKTPPPKPSFDGVNSYRAVGEWLAMKQRWIEAANRFSALMEIDKLDKWGPVTLDYQAYGVLLVESGATAKYEQFCLTVIEAYSGTTNGDAAGRVLKTCLLMPPGELLLKQMQPLGDAAEKYSETLDPKLFSGWVGIPVALWRYRTGDYDKAIEWAQRGLVSDNSSQFLPLRTILALCYWKKGDVEKARAELAIVRNAIDARFDDGVIHGDSSSGYWYDWLFARILFREAANVISPAN
jgi:serine/threonine protein kinase/tetratricopeptide (TPR) repeat protein